MCCVCGCCRGHSGDGCDLASTLCKYDLRIQNPFLTAQSTQIKSVISVPIKDFIHHYPRALFNDIPGSGRILTTYPGRGAV